MAKSTRSRTSKAVILSQIPSARRRNARDRKAGLRAVSAHYERATGLVMLALTSGYVFGFPTRAIPALAGASAEQLSAVELSPGGSGVHWEQLDVDLSIPGLLLASVGRSEKIAELARVAGRSTSLAKAAAARRNGAKGGRPRRTPAR